MSNTELIAFLLAGLGLAGMIWAFRTVRVQAAAHSEARARLEVASDRLSRVEAELVEAIGQRDEVDRLRQAETLRAGRSEAENESLEHRLDEIRDERHRLATLLDEGRSKIATLDRELAEAKLAAEKDAEAAGREIEKLKSLREEMTKEFRVMSAETLRVQGADMEKRHSEQLSALLTPFREQVRHFQSELQVRNEKTDEERVRLREQIEYLHKRSEDISREAVALTRALKGDSQQQGAWGEMILSKILEDSGLQSGIHYNLQASMTDDDGKTWRPDCTVNMPQERILVIDSKVSLVAYEEAVNAVEEDVRQAALARHVVSLRNHIKGLSAKGYQTLDAGTVDYVLMFIPIEGAFSDAMRASPALAREAIEARVGLITPTTLMLTLRTVDHIWTVDRRERNATDIANRAGQLYDKMHGVVEAIEDVGKAIEKAAEAHSTAISRMSRGRGNVIRQVEMLRDLGARAQKRIGMDYDTEDDPALFDDKAE